MTDEERHAWDSWCYEWWPEQAHGQLDSIRSFVTGHPNPRVVEVGGWRGDHAAACLEWSRSIVSWKNIEFCREAAYSSKTADARYEAWVPKTFRWWRTDTAPEGDLLVLSHVIEHLSARDFTDLLKAVRHIPRIYAEAPLPDGGTDWKGYMGTHILPWGWREAEMAFSLEGYYLQSRGRDWRVFAR